ncbi:MAG TPA: amino acid ABC transporter permease [Dongiaceae bacterium]|nr:amino acid ABC transporter permease [Dongiaceae bacterium]
MGVLELWTEIWPELLDALLASLKLALGALALGLALGLLLALARLRGQGPLWRATGIYIEVFRGTPALIQLFIIYFGLAAVGITFSSLQAAIIGLGLNAAAYLAEIFRAGIQAVPRGQSEAALAIGMNRTQVMAWIVLPQAARIVLAPVGNVAISLLKDTSVASLIAAPDLMLRAQDLSSQYFQPLQIYLIAGGIYFLVCFPLSWLVRAVEPKR